MTVALTIERYELLYCVAPERVGTLNNVGVAIAARLAIGSDHATNPR